MLTLAIFGQTGSGKTSLSNILFNLNWQTDNAVACTQNVTKHKGKIVPSLDVNQLTWELIDTPGVGESEEADENHFQAIYDTFHSVDVILWVIQGDIRAFAEDQQSILRLSNYGEQTPRAHFVIALNRVDQVYPGNWNELDNVPSLEQKSIIPDKVKLVYERFSPYLPILDKHIIPCSALKKYGLAELVNALYDNHREN